MAIYAISDLHLSFGVKEKPMDIFSDCWSHYTEKIVRNWKEKVKEEDTVLLAGDFSWATYLEDSLEDFKFLESLPGQKILLKGNHDYWWSTLKKMNEFLEKNGIKSVRFLNNNAIELEEVIVAGVRYWENEADYDNEKIIKRECIRAKLALEAAQKLNANKPILFMTHYPPDDRIIEVVKPFPVRIWLYGHIHSHYEDGIVEIEGIHTFLTSCDYLNFEPMKIL